MMSGRALGSSPQVRGTRSFERTALMSIGLIPAGAGNTAGAAPSETDFRLIPAGAGNTGRDRGRHDVPGAHPRRCGEHRSALMRICPM